MASITAADKAGRVLGDAATQMRRGLVLRVVVVEDLRGRQAIERSAAIRAAVAMTAVIGVAGAMANPVTTAICEPVAVRIPR